jgi:Fe-S-cluster-containing dehydrogenase component
MDGRGHLATGGDGLMSKWNMVVDVEKCDNCRVCFIAVKDEHNGNDFPGYAAAQPPQGTSGSTSCARSAATIRWSRRASCR